LPRRAACRLAAAANGLRLPFVEPTAARAGDF